jgi:hypothetical protein
MRVVSGKVIVLKSLPYVFLYIIIIPRIALFEVPVRTELFFPFAPSTESRN